MQELQSFVPSLCAQHECEAMVTSALVWLHSSLPALVWPHSCLPALVCCGDHPRVQWELHSTLLSLWSSDSLKMCRARIPAVLLKEDVEVQ